jgi:hypothetical protein
MENFGIQEGSLNNSEVKAKHQEKHHTEGDDLE